MTCTTTYTFKVIHLIFSCTLAPSAFVGNTLIIVSLCKYKQKFRGSLYMFTGNLAIADIVMATGVTLYHIDAMTEGIVANRIYVCFVVKALIGVSMISAGQMFMFMSLDRLCAVFRPLKHKVASSRPRKIIIIITISWVLAVSATAIPLSLGTVELSSDLCRFGLVRSQWFEIALAAAICWMIVFTHVTTAILMIKLYKKNKKIQSSKRQKLSGKTQLMARIYLLFSLSWLPFAVASFLVIDSPNRLDYVCFKEYAIIGGLVNSGFNWILYGLANEKFRDSFKLLLCGRCRSGKSSRNGTFASKLVSDSSRKSPRSSTSQ